MFATRPYTTIVFIQIFYFLCFVLNNNNKKVIINTWVGYCVTHFKDVVVDQVGKQHKSRKFLENCCCCLMTLKAKQQMPTLIFADLLVWLKGIKSVVENKKM